MTGLALSTIGAAPWSCHPAWAGRVMALVPASCQGTPLCEAYSALGQRPDPVWQRYAERMLDLVPLIERVCADVSVWGLLSHERLCLLAADDYTTPWYVIVSAPGGYDIRYVMAPQDAPWPGADVVGTGRSAGAAAEMVHIAMVRSRAWPDLR